MFQASIIIPTYQEEKQILVLLNSLNLHLRGLMSNVEIIIVNNGAEDISQDIARKHNASSYLISKTNVGAARNYGAAMASSELLIFLDADMEITQSWALEIQTISASTHAPQNLLTGNKVSIPDTPGWLEKYWFCEIPGQKINYINSANLLISRDLFKKLDGFDKTLVSGEDYDLSMRAQNIGANIKLNAQLIAIHHGYPKTAYNFIKREIWHGAGDFINLKSILKSKVAIATLIYILLHVTITASAFYSKPVAIASALSIPIFLLILSIRKYSQLPLIFIIINSTVFYLYFLGRSIAFFKSFSFKTLDIQ